MKLKMTVDPFSLPRQNYVPDSMISNVSEESDDVDVKSELFCCDKLRDISEELDSAKEQIAALEQRLSLGRCDFDDEDCFDGEMLYSDNKETAL